MKCPKYILFKSQFYRRYKEVVKIKSYDYVAFIKNKEKSKLTYIHFKHSNVNCDTYTYKLCAKKDNFYGKDLTSGKNLFLHLELEFKRV